MGGGKKKQKTGRLSTANQVKDRQKRLKQNFPNRERYKTYFIKKAVCPMLR
jgi:hypothetical protein